MAQIEIKLTDDSGTDAALVLESVDNECGERIRLYVTASGDDPYVYVDAHLLVEAAKTIGAA